ncbi:DNA polymerase III subunit beta [Candidatus Campbellbacteria bacterium CG11_big_fil_rev_8_21_14_0_20_44_21]|uniref:Beta sliding clamp n=1 Tax=Candidatus Campbellbacteria bacterium CG22_combo_CG10-13_8_21_14_all_43_18 TaxID=1974530 RepID=A0A2H0DWW6_9BACT|nr:MAG: DNA polymerase III subunit beta [Candidatus Campbellbacteria bacterium CG22_combo_CG10-13_8_21_14_all_43_18]PIR24206.1 MAG: DNA polymerase III subunit beta [Candidatus Campbellbacteria bacterium CG11_big_fil_rev_8_21_14_0_20_44_21]
MKFICWKEDLEKVLIKAERITGKNTTLPVLRGIFFDVGEKIIVKSTNLDIGLEMEVFGKKEKEGKILVDGNVLFNVISNIKKNIKLEIKKEDKKMAISGEKIKANIATLPEEDFPSIPKIKKEDEFFLSPQKITKGLKSVWFSASNSNIKPELSGIYIYKSGEKIIFVSTDSFRLSEKSIPIENLKEFEAFLLPTKNIPEIIRVLEGEEKDVGVVLGESQISFFSDNLYLTSRIISADFPDYKQIIPKEIKTTAVVLKEDFFSSLKLANIFADKFNQIIFKIDTDKKFFRVESKNPEKGEHTSDIEASLEGESLEIGFNYRYIMDVFASIPSDSLSLSFSGPGRPLLIKGVSDGSFLYIVMPMNK